MRSLMELNQKKKLTVLLTLAIKTTINLGLFKYVHALYLLRLFIYQLNSFYLFYLNYPYIVFVQFSGRGKEIYVYNVGVN